jgi:hypothetical protein
MGPMRHCNDGLDRAHLEPSARLIDGKQNWPVKENWRAISFKRTASWRWLVSLSLRPIP